MGRSQGDSSIPPYVESQALVEQKVWIASGVLATRADGVPPAMKVSRPLASSRHFSSGESFQVENAPPPFFSIQHSAFRIPAAPAAVTLLNNSCPPDLLAPPYA